MGLCAREWLPVCRQMTHGKLVGVRKSMRKFEVPNSILDVEVCRCDAAVVCWVYF